jgi:hypothetical protein
MGKNAWRIGQSYVGHIIVLVEQEAGSNGN